MRIEQFDADYLPRLEPVITAQRARTEAADPRLPHLPDSGSTISWLAERMENPSATGYLVEHKGEPLAFLIAVPTELAPDSFMSLFAPLHYAELSFAVADPTFISKTLHQLYTAAAEAMIETGYRIHRTSVLAAERELLDLWTKLAFGQVSTHAAAGLTDLPRSAPAVEGLSIRQSTRADAGFIRHLFERQCEWHTRSPVFQPASPTAIPTPYAKLEEELGDPHYAHFIAELDGKLVGICDGYWKEGKEPWLASTGRSPWAYLRNAFVAPEFHGRGIGRVVCLAFYEWLRAGCHAPYLYLDYFTVNPAGARYWPAQGFRPVVYRLQRVIPQEDE